MSSGWLKQLAPADTASKGNDQMNLNDKLVMAAISGLMLGAAGCASSQQPAETPAAEGEPAAAETESAAAAEMPAEEMAEGKHGCKGQNACKGQGGCKTDKNSCAGQNACKGQGGCKTT